MSLPPPPYSRFPSTGKGPLWREMPISGASLNILYRFLSEVATPPPRPPIADDTGNII